MGYFYSNNFHYINTSGSTVTDWVATYPGSAFISDSDVAGLSCTSTNTGYAAHYYYNNNALYLPDFASLSPILQTGAGKIIVKNGSYGVALCSSSTQMLSSTINSGSCSSASTINAKYGTCNVTTSSKLYGRYFVKNENGNSTFFSNYDWATPCSGGCNNTGTSCAGSCGNSATGSCNCSGASTISTACFSGDTLVTMADNTKKEISKLKMEDKILGYRNNELVEAAVCQTYISTRNIEIEKIIFEDENELLITNNHPIVTKEGCKTILPINDYETLSIKDDEVLGEDLEYHKIRRIVKLISTKPVYSLLTTTDNFIANGVVVSSESPAQLSLNQPQFEKISIVNIDRVGISCHGGACGTPKMGLDCGGSYCDYNSSGK